MCDFFAFISVLSRVAIASPKKLTFQFELYIVIYTYTLIRLKIV